MATPTRPRLGQTKPSASSQVDRGNPLARGLTNLWAFTEGNGRLLQDLVGQSPGVSAGGATWGGGGRDRALNFDGSTGTVSAGAAGNFTNLNWAVSFWVNPTGTNGQSYIYKGEDSVSGWSIREYFNQIRLNTNQSGAQQDTNTGGNTVSTGKWNHVVVSLSGTACTIWVNGEIPPVGGSYQGTHTAPADASAITFRIGSGNGNAYHNGLIDCVALWSRSLIQIEAISLYTNPFGLLQPAAPKGLWLVDALGGATLNRAMTESVTSADAWSRQGTFLRADTESVTSADAWSRVGTFLRGQTESTTQADAWTRQGTFARGLSESVASSDAWTRVGTFLRTTAESVTSGDAWTRSGTFLRSLTEAVTSADAWTGIKVILRGWSESVTHSDVFTRSGTFLRAQAESVTQVDVWTRSGTFLRALSESVTHSDVWTRVISGGVAIIGGLAPMIRAALHLTPSGRAVGNPPGGSASHQKPGS